MELPWFPSSSIPTTPSCGARPRPGSSAVPPGSWGTDAPRIDINTASVAELASLPGIGESKAKAIVEHRTVDPFESVDDLKKVKGIGDKMLESLRPSLTVGTPPAKKK